MAERQRTEIDAELLARVRAVAEAQGRPEAAILEEAVIGYLSFLYARNGFLRERLGADTADLGRPIREVYVTGSPSDPSTWAPRTSSELFALVDRWQRENGVESLSDEEALRLAVEEQHAMRNERAG